LRNDNSVNSVNIASRIIRNVDQSAFRNSNACRPYYGKPAQRAFSQPAKNALPTSVSPPNGLKSDDDQLSAGLATWPVTLKPGKKYSLNHETCETLAYLVRSARPPLDAMRADANAATSAPSLDAAATSVSQSGAPAAAGEVVGKHVEVVVDIGEDVGGALGVRMDLNRVNDVPAVGLCAVEFAAL